METYFILLNMFRMLFLMVCGFLTLSSRAQDKRICLKCAPGFPVSFSDSLLVTVSLQRYDMGDPAGKNADSKKPLIHFKKLKIGPGDLPRLIADSSILFISRYVQPVEELTTGAHDLSLNGLTLARYKWPQINGTSLRVAVKERAFDTTDIDLRGRVFTTGLEHSQQTAHASLMATIIAGAENTSPFALGAAPRAGTGSSSFDQLLADPDSIFILNQISVQNHSYGTVVENFYGNEAYTYDRQVDQIPELVHVFSSGNSGNSTPAAGYYSGVPSYANLTGNFEQAKNVITVGSVDSSGHVMPLSSRGPSFDGRIKPDLVAYGEDGSSGAAALVSGTAVLMQQAYKNIYQKLPSASLIKAALINGADDAGTPGIDYSSGYGSLNAVNSLSSLMQGQFMEDSVHQGEIRNLVIPVPAGTARLKLTLVWTDPVASVNATKSLVNDLDLQLSQGGQSQVWLPWVLDHSPTVSSLQAIPQRKKDTINTVEQISIELPNMLDHTVSIKGRQVQNGAQHFSLVWQLDTLNQFNWTYPTHQLIAGNTHWLRWQTNITGAGNIEFNTGGTAWQPLASSIDISQKYFRWVVPDTVTIALLRMQLPSGNYVVSDSFTISPQLLPETGFNCTDSFLIAWNNLGTPYRIYELKNFGLEPVIETTDSFRVLHKSQYQSNFYSVAPLIGDREGIRSNILNIAGEFCYLKSFYLQSQNVAAAEFFALLGTTYGVAEIVFEKFQVASGYIPLRSVIIPQQTLFHFSDSGLTSGINIYRLKIRLFNGQVIYSTPEQLYHFAESPVLVFPNPVPQGGKLQVVVSESGRYTLEILDMNGRVMKKEDLNNTLTEINAVFLSKGIYLVRITDRQGAPVIRKILVY